VNAEAYTSLTAFLAHRRALRELAARGPDQSARLAEMETLIAELSSAERDALESGAPTGDHARHRQRAQRHLSHLLRQRGMLPE
jgi:hypothetical protein